MRHDRSRSPWSSSGNRFVLGEPTNIDRCLKRSHKFRNLRYGSPFNRGPNFISGGNNNAFQKESLRLSVCNCRTSACNRSRSVSAREFEPDSSRRGSSTCTTDSMVNKRGSDRFAISQCGRRCSPRAAYTLAKQHQSVNAEGRWWRPAGSPNTLGLCNCRNGALSRLNIEKTHAGYVVIRFKTSRNLVPVWVLTGERVFNAFSPFLCYDSRNLLKA